MKTNFQNDCLKFPFQGLLTADSVDCAWTVFKSFVLQITDMHAPLKECKVRGHTIPWLTDELREAMYKRDHLRRLASRAKTADAYSQFRNQRNKTRDMLRTAKREYYETVINDSVKKPKTLWANLKTLLPKSSNSGTQSLLTGGKEVSDPQSMADAFNEFFTNVGKDLAKKFKFTGFPDIKTTCTERFRFKPIGVHEVCKILKGLNVSKAQGADGISGRVLKSAAKELSFPLATIFNYSLLTGTIPGEWKEALVSPVFKDGDRQDTSNYRPISVIPLV